MMKLILPIITIFLLSSCSYISSSLKNTPVKETSTANASNKTVTSKPDKSPAYSQYTIQPGDTLEISVWKEKDLQRQVVVRPDGKLTFPLVGDIDAAGLTYKQFKKSLTKKLSRYVPKPSITVASRESLGNTIYIIGKVNRPGAYPSNRNLDVMQALTLAGGLNPYASGRTIKILRRKNGKLKSIPFNYNKVKKGKNLEQNILLHGGDTVVVR